LSYKWIVLDGYGSNPVERLNYETRHAFSAYLGRGPQPTVSWLRTLVTALSECINLAGSKTPLKCADTLTVDTGAKVGQVSDAVQNVIGPNPDVWVNVGVYQDGVTGQLKDTSPQLATVPIWDTCALPITSASLSFPVAGWATLFIDGAGGSSGKTVNAHLVGGSSCNGGGTGTGQQATPVRLVTTQ